MPQPNKPNKHDIASVLAIIFILVVVLFYSTMKSNTLEATLPKAHYCTWVDCDHQGEALDQYNFVSYWGYEEMTDGWCVEMTHFMDPQLSYEECEAYVFSGVE